MEDQTTHQQLTDRIAIIGAGAAGLTAAHTLAKKGYRNVTVFEKSNRVGGKCCTVEIDDKRYELGAGIIAKNNTTLMHIVREHAIPLARVPFGTSAVVHKNGTPYPKKTYAQLLRLMGQLIRYRFITLRYARSARPGLAHTHPNITIPFAEFAKKHNISDLAQEFALFFTGFGYDYFSRVPAVYVLKYYNWKTVSDFITHRIYTLPQGIQHIWTKVAEKHNVRLNASITSITRKQKVVITTSQGEETFDTLILASPLDDALTFLDAEQKEHDLFTNIRTVDYCTLAVSATGLPPCDGYIPENFSPEYAGDPVFWYHRHKNTDVFTFYVLATPSQNDEELKKRVIASIQSLGGTVTQTHSITRWKYFPHVAPETLSKGFFDDLESLQGKNHTYYIGELLNFSTVGLTAQYAEHLIHRFF